MMKFTSKLNEVNAESKFTWTIGNLKEINLKDHNSIIIKSKIIDFKDADASWFLKLSLKKEYNGYKKLIFDFCLKINKPDENARFALKIVDESEEKDNFISHSFVENNLKTKNIIQMESNDGFIEVFFGAVLVSSEKDSIEFTASISMSTIVCGHEEPFVPMAIAPRAQLLPEPDSTLKQKVREPLSDNDFDHLADVDDQKDAASGSEAINTGHIEKKEIELNESGWNGSKLSSIVEPPRNHKDEIPEHVETIRSSQNKSKDDFETFLMIAIFIDLLGIEKLNAQSYGFLLMLAQKHTEESLKNSVMEFVKKYRLMD